MNSQPEPAAVIPAGGEATDAATVRVSIYNGQVYRIGSVDESAKEIYGKPVRKSEAGVPKPPAGLVLTVTKFKVAAGKFYTLTWNGRGQTWLTAEDEAREHRRKRDAVEAGQRIAAETGAYFFGA
jgi:hypothetical protein